MPKGKPWPEEVKRQVLKFANEGFSNESIAHRMDLPSNSVRDIISNNRRFTELRDRRLKDRRIKSERSCPKYLFIPHHIAAALELIAEEREIINTSAMIRKILDIIVNEPHLIDAILDGDKI